MLERVPALSFMMLILASPALQARGDAPAGQPEVTIANTPAEAEAPPDAEVFNIVRTIQLRYTEIEAKDFHEAKRTFREVIGDSVTALDLSALSPYQVSLIGPLLVSGGLDAAQREAAILSFKRAVDDERYGAAALLMLRSFDRHEDRRHLIRFLEHPAMAATMNTSFGATALNALALPPDLMLEHLDRVEAAVLAIHPSSFTEAPSRAAVSWLLKAFDHPQIADESSESRDRVHEHLLKIARSTVSRFAPTGGSSVGGEEFQIGRAVDLARYLEGPASRSSLVGRAAPAMEFSWVAGPDAPFTSLEDLRGRVVVVDFWATWCGPCVASFPELRALQSRFADDDVVIIGVTSIQGNHVPVGGRAVSLDDPEREKQLMGEYMGQNDITWNIAFSIGSVFDPAFGVWGIPHLTILDGAGTVQHNGPASATSTEAVVEIIDALLQEPAPR